MRHPGGRAVRLDRSHPEAVVEADQVPRADLDLPDENMPNPSQIVQSDQAVRPATNG